MRGCVRRRAYVLAPALCAERSLPPPGAIVETMAAAAARATQQGHHRQQRCREAAMMIAARIAEKLAGRRVKPCNGNYLACCPAHKDDTPSLSLRDGERGLLVNCFAGCTQSDIFVAIRRMDRSLLTPGATAPEPAKGSSE